MLSFEKIVSPFLEIKREEWKKTLLSFLYFFLVITAYYILKPARNSLYLDIVGWDNMPYVYLTIAVISYFVIALYTKFAAKIENNKMVSYFLFLQIAILLMFRTGFQLENVMLSRVVSFLFYIWVTFFSSIIVMQFWVLVNDIFDAQAAKRLYGFIGSGGIVGGIMGSFIASKAKVLGTENLLIVASAYILLMVFMYNYIWSHEKHNFVAEEKTEKEASSKREGWHIIRKSKYLLYVLLVVGIIKVVTALTEWQYNGFVDFYKGVNRDSMTAFFGKINMYLSYAALVIQVIFTSKILRRFGFAGALLPLPVGLFFGSFVILFYPVLWIAAILKISDGSLRYSINQTATHYLYLPVQRIIRYKIKPFIDVFGYQMAKGVGAILTVIYIVIMKKLVHAGDLSQVRAISFLNLGLIIIWFALIVLLKKEYPHAIRKFIKECSSVGRGRKKSFINDLLVKDPRGIMDDYEHLVSETHKWCVNVRLAMCVALYECFETREDLRQVVEEIVKSDGVQDAQYKNQGSTVELDKMLDDLISIKDPRVRYDSIKALNKMRDENTALDFDQSLVLQLIDQELEDYYKSFTVYSLHQSFGADMVGDKKSSDYLEIALRIIFELIVERIFRLMSLIYNSVDIFVIYQGILEDNVYVRANALELLNEIVEPTLAKKVFPLLDGEFSVFGPESTRDVSPRLDGSRVDVLRRSLRTTNRWLCLCAMFMISKFSILELREDIKHIKDSDDTLLAESAKLLYSQLQNKKS